MLKTVQTNQYDAVILAVPHKEFIDKGLQYIKSLCSKESLFFDIKGAFSQEESQFRL